MADRRMAPRYGFRAAVELVDLASGKQITSFTSNLSCYGCYIKIKVPFSPGATVALKINHRNTHFLADATVVYALEGEGMGIRFDNVANTEEIILARWLREAKANQNPIEDSASGAKKRRARRNSYVGGVVEVIDLDAGIMVVALVRVLSSYGCLITTDKPFRVGKQLMLRFVNSGIQFSAMGRIIDIVGNEKNSSLGIEFKEIDPVDRLRLEDCLAELARSGKTADEADENLSTRAALMTVGV